MPPITQQQLRRRRHKRPIKRSNRLEECRHRQRLLYFQPPELPSHFEKLPPAEKGRDGKFKRTKRSGGEPFERVCVLMPPELVEAVLEIAEDAELPASTIWRRAVILGLEAARAEAESGIDLSRE